MINRNRSWLLRMLGMLAGSMLLLLPHSVLAQTGYILTFNPLVNQTYGVAPYAISATASYDDPVSFVSQTTSVCTVAGASTSGDTTTATVTIGGTGTCTIAASAFSGSNAQTKTQSFTVSKGTQTITFGSLASKPLGSNFSLSATSSSGLAVTFTSTTTSICTVSGNTVTPLALGTCTIDANQAGNANYSAAAQVAQSTTITTIPQTISFAALASKTFGVAPFTVSATSSSGLAVAFTSATTSVCTVSGSTVTLVAPGTCTIDANQAGNTDYTAAAQVAQSFTVSQEAQTITFAALTSKPYGTPFTLSATSSSGLAVTYTSATTSVCTVSGSTVTPVAPGTCTIDANQAGNTNFAAAAQVAQSATITTGPQTITFGALANQTYGAAPFAVSATSSSGLAVAFTSATTGVCTVSGSTVTLVSGGTCTIDANQAGNTDYAAATQVAQTFTVAKEAQTITFGVLTSQPYGATFALAATSSSGLAVTYTSATTSVCTVSGSTVTPVALGTCTIDANQAGNTNYAAATQVAQSATITTGSQTITFGALASKTYGAAAFAVSATSTSGLTVAFTSATTGVCTVSGSTVTLVAPGTCTIDANQAGNTDYTAAAQVAQSFTVSQEAQTITFAALTGKTYGAAPFAVSATASSGLTVAFSSATPSVCTVSGTTVTLVAGGTCTIDANQAGNTDYAAATQVLQSFTVAPEAQTITFGTLSTKPYGTPFTVSATSTSGLAVTFTSATTGVCTVSGTTVTPVALGTCTIDANQAGSASYSAATQVAQSATIAAGSQTITFAALTGQTYGTPFTVSATSTSGLAVTFTSATTSVCTVSGTTVTPVAAGTCTIDANQAGNADYSAAPQVAQSATIAQEAQTITFNTVASQTDGEAPFTVTATSTSGLAVTITSATTSVCTVSGNTVTLLTAGSCTLNANQAGNADYAAAAQVSQTVTVGADPIVVTLTSPIANQQLDTPVNLTLSASVKDSSGTVTQVAFYNGTTLMGTVTSSPYTLEIPNAAAGSYQITAKVTDSNNYTATSAAVNVTLAANSSGEQIYFINADQLNTPRVITNSDGVTVWQWDGEAFGNTPPNSNPSGLGTMTFNLRFPGQYADTETGLNQNFHRDYDPSTGRYVESDPIGLAGGKNTFSYVGSNPLNLTDPSGLCPFCIVIPLVCADGGCEILAAIIYNAIHNSPVIKPAIPDVCPDNLCEQLALAEAKAGAGAAIMWNLGDEPRLVAIYGPGPWVKMQHTHICPNGRMVVVHYFSNGVLNVELKIV